MTEELRVAFKSKLESPLRVPPAPFERNVLLLDATEARQLARAAAMRIAGATVQCVSTVEAARAAWKPGSHQLVMIDLEGKGAAFREFYDYARTLSAKQAFAFYVPYPPYLSSTPNGNGQGAPRAVEREKPMSVAVTRISASRAASRARRETAESRSSSFSEAVKAAEREAENKS
ncbi:MAG TPA: hypothetical protein VL382_07630 [Terriglobales bacterium]|nr:hypothetical protein [Terriglobales bacterium]